MRKTIQSVFLAWAIASLMLPMGSFAWAKEGEAHHGWHQGKKTGWHGGDQPPGHEKKKHHHKHHPKGHHHEGEQGEEKKEAGAPNS